MSKKRIKSLKGEKIVWLFIFILVVSIPLIHVFTKAMLSETNITVEKLKSNIADQENVNESLNMKINELASLDKIKEVASSNGLSYNDDNIEEIQNK